MASLAQLDPTIAKTVLVNSAPSSDAGTVAAMNPAQISQLASAVDTIGPQIATAQSPAAQSAIVQAAAADPVTKIAVGIAALLIATGEAAKWGTTSSLNPVSAISRRKSRPVKFLPSNGTASAAGGLTLTWSPQEAFEGFRFCVPSGSKALAAAGASFVTNLIAGDRLLITEPSNRAPCNLFRENSDMGRIDFPNVQLGETITAVFSALTPNTELGAVILGYGSRVRVLPDGAELLYERLEPFDTTSVTGSSTATITLHPQRNIILRRVGFDDSTTNWAGSIWVTSLTVQDMPQFVANTEMPAQLFSELAQDDWIDFDMCQLGGTITIGLRNQDTNAVIVDGMALCDVVKLAHETRR